MGDGFCRIYVDDDGPGLDKDGQEQLLRKMQEPLQEEMGCGLWNTNRRLMHLFGEGSCLRFCDSPLGGFRTELIWRLPEEKEKQGMALPEVQGASALA
jgi:two-component system sensor histidine kinase YesM